MRNYSIYLIISLIIICSCERDVNPSNQPEELLISENAIGIDNEGAFVFKNKEVFTEDWQKKLRHTGINLKMRDFKLVTGNLNNSGETWILVAENQDRTMKTAIALDKIGNEYFINNEKGTVTCSGTCIDGCDPEDLGDRWTCSSCNQFGGQTCVKTVTKEIED